VTEEHALDGYLNINEFSNALDYLRKGQYFLSQFDDPFRWKWLTLCLSSALYGFMIAALGVSNYGAVVKYKKKDERKLEELSRQANDQAYMNGLKIKKRCRHARDIRLIKFKDALNLVQDARWMGKYTFSKQITLSREQHDQVLKLRSQFRNYFEHYLPKVWVIEEGVFIPLLCTTADTIEKLFSSGNLYIRRELPEARQVLVEVKELLQENERRLRRS